MKQRITYKKVAGILVGLLLFICSGCIHEELPECEDEDICIRFNFIYDYNMEYTDLFHEQVDHITLLVYTEESGELEQTLEIYREDMEDNHTVSLMLPPGRHTAVAWGNCHTDHYHLYGHETTSGHQLEMTCIDADYKMTRVNPGSLFHASNTFTMDSEDQAPIPMVLTKNSNQVKVVIKGLTLEDWEKANERFKLRLTSKNWRYNFNNTLSSEQEITYITERVPEEAPNEDAEEITVAFMFYPLRLFTNDLETVLTLSYRNPQTGREAALEKPLVPYLISQNGGNPGITPTIDKENEYLDRKDTYDVTFVMGVDVHGNIEIKEWDSIKQPGEL